MRRTAGKITKPGKLNYRVPPKPIYYYQSLPGKCRLCGLDIINNKGEINNRAKWHRSRCVELYLQIWQAGYAKKQVWKRDKGICAICNKKCFKGQWQMDHILPLYTVNSKHELTDFSYWEMTNLQTLCIACHKNKCAEENLHRVELRKEREHLNENIDSDLSIEDLLNFLNDEN